MDARRQPILRFAYPLHFVLIALDSGVHPKLWRQTLQILEGVLAKRDSMIFLRGLSRHTNSHRAERESFDRARPKLVLPTLGADDQAIALERKIDLDVTKHFRSLPVLPGEAVANLRLGVAKPRFLDSGGHRARVGRILPEFGRREERALQLERDAIVDGVGKEEIRLVFAEFSAKILVDAKAELRRLVLHLVERCELVKWVDEQLAVAHVLPEHRRGYSSSTVSQPGRELLLGARKSRQRY